MLFGQSANGKGRTLWDIITGQNLKNMTPLELQYHNPIKASIGVSVSIENDLELSGINFFLEGINVYQVRDGNKKLYSTDYVLRGITLGAPKPIRLRLRITPDDDADTGYLYKVFRVCDEMPWDQGFHDDVLRDPTNEFYINQDDDGNQLEEKRTYWRINDCSDSYSARLTSMKDVDKNGSIEDSELEHTDVTYWDYSRETTNTETDQKYIEYFIVEMDNETRYFTMFCGRDIHPSQVSVV